MLTAILPGGGQILRNTLALSGILTMPIHVQHIRGGRSVSGTFRVSSQTRLKQIISILSIFQGLLSQHATGVALLEQLYSAEVVGKELASTDLRFHPKDFCPGKYTADAKTAG